MNPLALDPRGHARDGPPHGRPAGRAARRRRRGRPCAARRPAEMAARLPFGAPEAPQGFDALLGTLRARRAALHGAARPPRLHGVRPVLRHVPGRARRLHRLRAEHLRGHLDGGRRARASSSWSCSTGSRSGSAIRARRPALLVSGGSAANLTALACAREALLGPMDDRAVVYVGDQGHASIARAARVLGFRPDRCACSRATTTTGCGPRGRRARSRPTRRAGGGRCWWRPPPARRTPARSTRSRTSPRSAASTASGCTSTRPTAASPR